MTGDQGRRVDPAALFHPWPESKGGGSDPDRCPSCGKTTYVRAQRLDGQRWHRPDPASASCAGCGTTWELAPPAEPVAAAAQGGCSDSDVGRPDAAPLRLAIVGSRSLEGHAGAARVIREVLDDYRARHPDLVVVSGGARGIDRMAAAEARRRGVPVVEHLPVSFDWPGFRKRDQLIAEDCHELVRIADPRSRTYGSGWTRDRARELGKPTAEYVIDGVERGAARIALEVER